MDAIDPRLRAALVEQLARRREVLRAGARHVGWKLGLGERESVGGSIAVGYLTSATVIEPGGTYETDGLAAELRADVEIAVELRADVHPRADADAVRDAIAGYATALEIVDLAPVLEEPEAVVAANVFHRAVAFGSTQTTLPSATLRATARVNDADRGAADAGPDLTARLLAAARILDVVGQRLKAGDRVITGSVVQVPIAPGDSVTAVVSALGEAQLSITR